MTIDCCTRHWVGARPWKADGPPTSTHALHAGAATHADISLVLGARSERLGIRVSHETIAAFVDLDAERRLGMGGIDPLADDALGEVTRLGDLGLVGAVLAPADQGCPPTHTRARRVLERCAELAMPVVLSNPVIDAPRSRLAFGDHALLDEPLGDLPELRVVLSDVGSVPLEHTLTMIAKHEHCYAEVSAVAGSPGRLHRVLAESHERGVAHKLLLGSGFPAVEPDRAIEAILSTNRLAQPGGPTIPREALEEIIQRDALRLLGIDTRPAPGSTSVAIVPAQERRA